MGGRAMSGEPDPNRLPGVHLYRLFQAACADQTLDLLVEPTIADLQHEVAVAGQNRARRCLAYLRGCAGLFRVLITQFGTGRLRMRRWVMVLALGIAGAALLVGLYLPGVNLLPGITQLVAPFLLPAIVIPVVLRRLGLGANFRQMSADCSSRFRGKSTPWQGRTRGCTC